MIHFIFTNSAFSNTGFRVNLRNGGYFKKSHYMSWMGQMDSQEFWYPQYTTSSNYNILDHLDQWVCTEFHMSVDGGQATLDVYVDNSRVSHGSYPASQTNFTYVILSGYTNMTGNWAPSHSADYFVDEVVIANTQIGCKWPAPLKPVQR
jgi:hypothetical protein